MVGSIIWIKTYISPASAHNGHYQTGHDGCAGALVNSWYLPEDRVWNCPRYNVMDHRQTFQSGQRTEKDMTRAPRTGVRRLTELWGRITNRSWGMGYHQPSNPSVLPHNGEENKDSYRRKPSTHDTRVTWAKQLLDSKNNFLFLVLWCYWVVMAHQQHSGTESKRKPHFVDSYRTTRPALWSASSSHGTKALMIRHILLTTPKYRQWQLKMAIKEKFLR